MDYVLAIDQGTTGTRALVYDKEANIIASAYEEFPQYFPEPGWVEHDPNEIWQSVINSINKVLRKVSVNSIKAIGITNQRETTVVWDRESGEPITKAIVWQCRRTAKRCDNLKKREGMAAKIRKKTGLPIDAYFSASKLEWILKNVPKASIQARQGKLCFGTTDSWILWKLTGGLVHATDYSNASRTMLFNIDTLEWDEELLKLFKIPTAMLPEVKQSSGFFGETVKIGKLKAGIPITGIAGDQQAALFGQACFKAGSMKNTYGTGAFALLNTGKKRINSKAGLITTLGCGAKGEPIYVLEGAIFIAGAAIQWLRDEMGLIRSAQETEQMAWDISDNGGVYFVPAFVGLGAPYWDQDARASISGITRGTTKKHIVRAALEAMAYQSKDVIDAMEKDSNLKVKTLKVDGGAVVNDFLCQFQADILGADVVRPQVIESTSLGAAYLAGLAVGYWKNSKDIAKYWKVDTVFKSIMDKKQSIQIHKAWKKAVERVTR